MTLAAPVAFSFLAFVAFPALSSAALAAAALVLTKGVGLVPLAPSSCLGSARQDRRRGAVALAAGGAAVTLALLAADWLTELLDAGVLSQGGARRLRDQLDARSTQQLAPALFLAGHILLVVATARLRRVELLAAVVAGVGAVWFVGGHGADAALVLSALLVAFELRQ